MRALVIVFLISGSFLCQSKSYFAICSISFCFKFHNQTWGLYSKAFSLNLHSRRENSLSWRQILFDDTEVERRPGAQKPAERVWERKVTFIERNLMSWIIFLNTTCNQASYQEKVTLFAMTRLTFFRNLFKRQWTDRISHFLTKGTKNAESDRRPFLSKLEFMDFGKFRVIQWLSYMTAQTIKLLQHFQPPVPKVPKKLKGVERRCYNNEDVYNEELQNPFVHVAFFVSEFNKIRSNLNSAKSMSPCIERTSQDRILKIAFNWA